MDQRSHLVSGGGPVLPEQGPRQAPYYYDYPAMSGLPPPASYAPTSLQAPAYYPTPQHASLLDAGGLGDPACGVAAAMWNGNPGNPYGSPSSSSSFTSGGAHPSYFTGYDYYVCNNMAYYPQSNLTPPGAVATAPQDYQHPHHHSAPPQLPQALSSPPYCYAPHLQSHSSCNGNDLNSVSGVNAISGEMEQGAFHDSRRSMFHATASPSQIPYSSGSLKKADRHLMNASNHLQHLYSTPVDANSLVNSMQHMSLQNAAAVAVAAAVANAAVSSSSQPPPTSHSNYRSGLNVPHHQEVTNGTRGNLVSHASSSQSSSVQTSNVTSQQTRSLVGNGAYMAVTSNSGSVKSWACIAGQPPRGSAATLGNSIVSGIGATTIINGNGYSVDPSPEEELNSLTTVKEEVSNAVQRQPMYSSSVYNGRDQQPTAHTPPAHSQYLRQNGSVTNPHSAPDYNYQTRTATIFSEPKNFGPYGNAQPISTSLSQTQQYYVPPTRSTNMATQMQPAHNFSSHETTYNLEEANKLLNNLRASLNRPDFDIDNIKLARVFVIKSFSEEDVHRSMKYGVWCSTERGNERLHQAYVDMQARGGRVFLCFSVNSSGHFCGFCEMISGVNMEKRCGIWADPRWRGELRVQWHFVKDVPNAELRHIRVESNDNKSVTNSRDCTEVTPLEKGLALMRCIAKCKHRTCFLDDFLHYEMKEIDMRANNQLISNPRS